MHESTHKVLITVRACVPPVSTLRAPHLQATAILDLSLLVSKACSRQMWKHSPMRSPIQCATASRT